MYTADSNYIEAEVDYQYHRLQTQAEAGRLLGHLTGHPRALPSLTQALDGFCICGQRQEGLKTVPLSHIVGSEGRCGDFDRQFRPLKTHTHERWYRVARAHLTGIPLPPVDLIRVGDEYYVRDGNHRVSVARAFGQAAIEALVTEYHLVPRTMIAAQELAGETSLQGAVAAA